MAGSLKGTKTHENLKEAFAGESQANRRYLYFASVADIEGYPDVGGLFRDTAEAETGHAFGHLDFLKEAGDPATGEPIGKTEKNLKAAVAGETYEYTQMYPGMAKTARDEGFAEIAEWFETLAKAEKSHAGRFKKGLDQIAGRSRPRRSRARVSAGAEGRCRLLGPDAAPRPAPRAPAGESSESACETDDTRHPIARVLEARQRRHGAAPRLRHLQRLPPLPAALPVVQGAVRPPRRATRWTGTSTSCPPADVQGGRRPLLPVQALLQPLPVHAAAPLGRSTSRG